jgi:hypothetical protein
MGERRLCHGPPRARRQAGIGPGRLLSLERLEGAQRAHELRLRRAAIAQEGLDRPGAVAVAHQPDREIAVVPAPIDEQLGLDAIGPGEPPGGHGHAPREHHLECAHGRELKGHRRLERLELGRILPRQHDVLLCPEAMLQRVP